MTWELSAAQPVKPDELLSTNLRRIKSLAFKLEKWNEMEVEWSCHQMAEFKLQSQQNLLFLLKMINSFLITSQLLFLIPALFTTFTSKARKFPPSSKFLIASFCCYRLFRKVCVKNPKVLMQEALIVFSRACRKEKRNLFRFCETADSFGAG